MYGWLDKMGNLFRCFVNGDSFLVSKDILVSLSFNFDIVGGISVSFYLTLNFYGI